MSAQAYFVMACCLAACCFYIGVRCGWLLHKEKIELDLHMHPTITHDPMARRMPVKADERDPLAPYRIGTSQTPFPRKK